MGNRSPLILAAFFGRVVWLRRRNLGGRLRHPADTLRRLPGSCELLALPDEELASYIIGYINAISISVAFGAKAECIEQAHQCIAHLGTDEVGTALRRYIARDPKRLETPASHLTFQVMYSRCVNLVDKGMAT